jgi:uncharacterized protein YjeT (DUF2065 family)
MAGFLITIGIILLLIAAAISPKEDKRYKSGFTDNKSDDSSNTLAMGGTISLILGCLIAWLF